MILAESSYSVIRFTEYLTIKRLVMSIQFAEFLKVLHLFALHYSRRAKYINRSTFFSLLCRLIGILSVYVENRMV